VAEALVTGSEKRHSDAVDVVIRRAPAGGSTDSTVGPAQLGSSVPVASRATAVRRLPTKETLGRFKIRPRQNRHRCRPRIEDAVCNHADEIVQVTSSVHQIRLRVSGSGMQLAEKCPLRGTHIPQPPTPIKSTIEADDRGRTGLESGFAGWVTQQIQQHHGRLGRVKVAHIDRLAIRSCRCPVSQTVRHDDRLTFGLTERIGVIAELSGFGYRIRPARRSRPENHR